MDTNLAEQKKAVLPFMQRAQEIQQADPKVAYYCRMYAVEQALKFNKRAKDINDLIIIALSQMEKEKPKLALDKDNDRFQCEAMAMKVFSNAEKVDRAGRADKSTAKAFLAASYFLEILNHFGPVDGDLLEKQRYAAWRAAEISKAVREGRPTAPPAPATSEASAEQMLLDLPAAYGGGSFTDNRTEGSMSGQPSSAMDSAPGLPALVGVQRFKPGSRVVYLAGSEQELGTVGQAFSDPNGNWRFRVALRERLQDAAGTELAPQLAPGDPVMWLGSRSSHPVLAHALLVNNDCWPHTYLLQMPDGTEQAATADQLSLMLPLGESSDGHAGPVVTGPDFSVSSPDSGTGIAGAGHVYGHSASSSHDFSSHAAPVSQPALPPPPTLAPVPQPVRAPAPAYSAYVPPTSQAKPSIQAIMEAQKNAKYAVSSLNFEDVTTAVKYLQTAIKILTTPQ